MISLWHHLTITQKDTIAQWVIKLQISRGVYRKRSLGRAFLLKLSRHYSSTVGAKCFGFLQSANEVVPPLCRSIGNDWANFLAFYLVVSILSSDISIPASHWGDRFLSKTEETRRLTRASFSVTPLFGIYRSRYYRKIGRAKIFHSIVCSPFCFGSFVTNANGRKILFGR